MKKKKGRIIVLMWKLTVALTAIGILLTIFTNNEKYQLIYFISSLVLGTAMLIIGDKGSNYINYRKNTNAQKYDININNYHELIKYLNNNSKLNSANFSSLDGNNINIFYKVEKHWYNYFNKNIFIIVTVSMELFDDKIIDTILQEIDEYISKCVEGYSDSDYIEMSLVLCLEKENNEFKKYINRDIIQTPNIIKLPVGIVFTENKIYISNQESSYNKGKYKLLIEKFMKLFKNIIKE